MRIAEQYDNILSDLKSHCGILLNLTETLDTVKTEARLAQSALYDTAQAVSDNCSPRHLFNQCIFELTWNFFRPDLERAMPLIQHILHLRENKIGVHYHYLSFECRTSNFT